VGKGELHARKKNGKDTIVGAHAPTKEVNFLSRITAHQIPMHPTDPPLLNGTCILVTATIAYYTNQGLAEEYFHKYQFLFVQQQLW
jgi:hypothetical protein